MLVVLLLSLPAGRMPHKFLIRCGSSLFTSESRVLGSEPGVLLGSHAGALRLTAGSIGVGNGSGSSSGVMVVVTSVASVRWGRRRRIGTPRLARQAPLILLPPGLEPQGVGR